MLLKSKVDKVIILGINDLSLHFAKKINDKKNVVLLDNNSDFPVENIDVIQSDIKYDLYNSLIEYDIAHTDLFIAMTDNEEYNLFSTSLAAELGVENTISMVYSNNYINMSAADYIFNPYQLILNRISSFIQKTRLKNIKKIIPGKVNITEFTVKNNDKFSYKKIKEFKIDDSIIICIKKGKKILIPSGEERIYPGDIVYLLYREGIVRHILNYLLKRRKTSKDVFIIGGNDLGLLQALDWRDIYNIIIIEADKNKCNQLAEKTDKFMILHGEGVDANLLKDEGINKSSIFLSLDNNDLHNLLSSYTADNIGCDEVITLLNHNGYQEIAHLLGLNKLILLPELITKHILLYLKAGHKLNKYIIRDKIYTTRLRIKKNSNIVNKHISDLNLLQIVIGVIIRNNKVIIPSGKSVLKEDDEIMVFYSSDLEKDLNVIFA
ncbi:MAG: TrkA C-terminal domain-containing protein [bacterium]